MPDIVFLPLCSTLQLGQLYRNGARFLSGAVVDVGTGSRWHLPPLAFGSVTNSSLWLSCGRVDGRMDGQTDGRTDWLSRATTWSCRPIQTRVKRVSIEYLSGDPQFQKSIPRSGVQEFM